MPTDVSRGHHLPPRAFQNPLFYETNQYIEVDGQLSRSRRLAAERGGYFV
jgi:hypothetical protein